jgi:5-formyltetrahydrofolate cyclo-ligase
MTDPAEEKRSARAAAMARRAALHAGLPGAARQAAGHLLDELARVRHLGTVSAYLPIRDELDPLPGMLALAGLGYRLCVPVIEGSGLPLRFREWAPGAAVVPGPFGVAVPSEGDWLVPEVLVVPMLAFDARAFRLGYGGGFYDRTLAALRADGEVLALGFAYAGQEVPLVPHGPRDQHLDAVVTEAGVVRPE